MVQLLHPNIPDLIIINPILRKSCINNQLSFILLLFQTTRSFHRPQPSLLFGIFVSQRITFIPMWRLVQKPGSPFKQTLPRHIYRRCHLQLSPLLSSQSLFKVLKVVHQYDEHNRSREIFLMDFFND